MIARMYCAHEVLLLAAASAQLCSTMNACLESLTFTECDTIQSSPQIWSRDCSETPLFATSHCESPSFTSCQSAGGISSYVLRIVYLHN